MNKLIVLALSALMSFGAYAGNVRKSPNRSNNRAQRVNVQQAQSNRSWIEAAKSTAGVQFRSSVVNDLDSSLLTFLISRTAWLSPLRTAHR